MEKIVIDNAFITKWAPRYNEHDEEEYQKIITEVSREVCKNNTISQDIFIRILNWKDRRVKGIVEKGITKTGVNTYEEIEKCLKLEEKHKVAELDKLYGIGVPVASTILHFIYPNKFPIMDVRTAESLYYSCYIKSKQRSQKCYDYFRSVILDIAERCKQPLRQIDKALFAYHKVELEPEIRRCCKKRKESP